MRETGEARIALRLGLDRGRGKGTSEDRHELRRALDDASRGLRQQIRQAGCEHDLIAQALFGVYEQFPVVQRLSLPFRQRQCARHVIPACDFARLVIGPRLCKAPELQPGE